jgi:hypothetical protein
MLTWIIQDAARGKLSMGSRLRGNDAVSSVPAADHRFLTAS